jgi:molybdopterin molybdotransferase
MAQVSETGIHSKYLGIALDTLESTTQLLQEAILQADVTILTGGVSMGDFDYVPEVLNNMGIQIQFKSIAVQPGRPTVFGTKAGKYFFGLPGNPVSSFVQFNLLVKPLLLALSGAQHNHNSLKMRLGTSIKRKKAIRKSFIPVRITNNNIFPVDYHGSAHINAYTQADGMIALESGIYELQEGALIDVRLL